MVPFRRATEAIGGRNEVEAMIEQYFTINELAERLKTSLEKTRLMVKDEPGVLRIVPETTGAKKKSRPKAMYRIPESVIERILRRSANPARA